MLYLKDGSFLRYPEPTLPAQQQTEQLYAESLCSMPQKLPCASVAPMRRAEEPVELPCDIAQAPSLGFWSLCVARPSGVVWAVPGPAHCH